MLKYKDYNLNSAVFYEGASELDGKPIVGIITNLLETSKNGKTGEFTAQSYIMRSDISPLSAAYGGGDYSVCGNCPLKPSNQNICYVNLAKAPQNIWKAYRKNRYLKIEDYPLERIGSRLLRFGAYGDPTAIPIVEWQPLINKFPQHTGYTHQWRSCDEVWKEYLMASCETTGEVEIARILGWRTARVINPDSPKLDNEILCRNQAEEDLFLKPQCMQCKLCDGNKGRHLTDIVFNVHGSRRKHYR